MTVRDTITKLFLKLAVISALAGFNEFVPDLSSQAARRAMSSGSKRGTFKNSYELIPYISVNINKIFIRIISWKFPSFLF